ncbi:MAG: cytochrome c3 family protein [Planctomycetota bacterium]
MDSSLGPAIVILGELEDRYLPVPFDHQGHAEMAKMTRGCAVCHHLTPEGAEHPACKECHELTPVRVDIRKPGLKGAYHRQCLSCHREWDHQTGCDACHVAKTGRREPNKSVDVPSVDDIVGRMHPPIKPPDTEIFSATAAPMSGTKIVFRHSEHTARFGLKCVECHHEDNCLRCHNSEKVQRTAERTPVEHHQPCFSCHHNEARNPCERCHVSEGQAPPPPFDHASVGWPLSRYHRDKSCRSCHVTVPFGKLNTKCDSCHKNWTSSSFDHAVTGQQLNDVHSRFDCVDCHLSRRFESPPTCSECHEGDNDIAFPAKRPGPIVPVTNR